jgi:hypothetical protein
VGARLLADIRDAFGIDDHLSTSALLGRLHELTEAPWADWYGKPLTARGLAKLLEPYRIVPANRRLPGETRARGYFRSDFADAWERYAPPEPVPPVPPVPDHAMAGLVGSDGTLGTVPAGESEIPVEVDYPRSAWEPDGTPLSLGLVS